MRVWMFLTTPDEGGLGTVSQDIVLEAHIDISVDYSNHSAAL